MFVERDDADGRDIDGGVCGDHRGRGAPCRGGDLHGVSRPQQNALRQPRNHPRRRGYRDGGGYTPNALARALAPSTTNPVGSAISASRNPCFGDGVNAIEAECAASGMMVLLAHTRDDPAEELRAVNELHRRRVDGVLLAASAGPETPALNYLRDNAVPTVLVDRLPDAGFDGIGVENVQAIGELVDRFSRRPSEIHHDA